MRVIGAFKAFNAVLWREKVLAQMNESTWLFWEGLGLSPMYANCMLF